MIMIVVGIGITLVVIILAIKTYHINKKVERMWDYLDIQATRKEQEDDDQMWNDRIDKGNGDFKPNPTRNQKQIKKNYEDLLQRINQTTESMTQNANNVKVLTETTSEVITRVNRQGGWESARDQEPGAPSPLLGQ